MSSTSLPGNDLKAPNICDSPETPNIKKVKLDQCQSADKPQKDIPRSSNVPSTAYLSKPILTQKSVDVPASAFKVGSICASPFSVVESFDMDSEGQRYQTQKKYGGPGNESKPQDMNKVADQEDQDSEIKLLEDIVLASSPDCLKAEGKEGTRDAVVDTTTDLYSQDFDVHTSFQASSDDNVDAMDSQEEGDTQTEDSTISSSDVWEVVSKKQRGKTRNKKKVDKETKPKKPPPNAFVAVRIPSPDISAKFEEVQRALQEKDERLKQIFVPAAKNHITLMVMSLNSPEDLETYVGQSEYPRMLLHSIY
jgi:hypothetical protein